MQRGAGEERDDVVESVDCSTMVVHLHLSAACIEF